MANVVQELRFFQTDDAADETLIFPKGRIGGGETRNHGVGNFGHEGPVEAKLTPIADGPPDDAAQHVATVAIGRNDAVADEEGSGPGVLGNDADGVIGFGGLSVFMTGEIADGVDDGLEEVGLIDVGLALQHGGGALEAHSGIDAGGWQRGAYALEVLVELHEDQVPQLNEPLAVAVGMAAAGLGGGATLGFDPAAWR